MNCLNHPELAATAFCRVCGKPLCTECQRLAQGTVFCAEHAPEAPPFGSAAQAVADSPWTAPAGARAPVETTGASPGLAFLLGLIPGVGAIYNGQYAKGLVHVVILGLLISIQSSGAAGDLETLFGFLIALWFPYMAFEAFHTAKRRQMGLPVDEFSSLFPRKSPAAGRFPVAPIVLIALGVLFLLNNMEIIRFYQMVRYWPVFLIAAGAYMLYTRMAEQPRRSPGTEVGDERQ